MSQFSIFHSYFFVVKVQVKFLIYILKYILFCITIFFISIFLFTFFTHKKILLHASPFFGNRDDSGTYFAPFSRPVIVKMFKSTHSFLLLKYELVSVCVWCIFEIHWNDFSLVGTRREDILEERSWYQQQGKVL